MSPSSLLGGVIMGKGKTIHSGFLPNNSLYLKITWSTICSLSTRRQGTCPSICQASPSISPPRHLFFLPLPSPNVSLSSFSHQIRILSDMLCAMVVAATSDMLNDSCYGLFLFLFSCSHPPSKRTWAVDERGRHMLFPPYHNDPWEQH